MTALPAPAKVLVVDDHPINLKLLRVLLESEGYEVLTATDAAEVLALLQTAKPALLLVDIQLPDLDGLELTRRLKRDPATRDLPVVAVTAYAMKGDEARLRAAGCDAYIAKPINVVSFARQVAAALGTSPPMDLDTGRGELADR